MSMEVKRGIANKKEKKDDLVLLRLTALIKLQVNAMLEEKTIL